MKEQEKWGRGYYQDDSRWGWYPPEHKYVRSSRKKARDVRENDPQASASVSPTIGSVTRGKDGRTCTGRDETSRANYGVYHDWADGDILKEKLHYVSYICNESMESSPSQQQFQEWMTLMEYERENR